MKTFSILTLSLFLGVSAVAQQIFDQINFGGISSMASAIAINSQDHIFVGTIYNEGIYRSTTNGASFVNLKPHANVRDIYSIAITSDGTIIVGMDGTINDAKGLFVSTNNGDNWSKMGTGLPVGFVKSVAISPNGYVYASVAKEVYLSTDTCKSWVLKSSGLSTTYSVDRIVCSPNGYVYLYQYKSIYRSTNNGDLWTKMENGWVGDNIWDLFVNTKGYIFIATNAQYIYRSTNNGDSWSQFSSGLTVYNGKVLSIGENSAGDMFAGSMNASTVATLYRSTNDGVNWSVMGTAVCYNNLALLTFDSQGFLYASCGGALYKSQQSTISGVEDDSHALPKDYYLYQNYPNPFNPITKIEYQVPTQSHVSLRIFDVLGREVTKLVNGIEEPGYKSVNFNANGLVSGVYFYHLKAGSYVETKKLILLR